MTIDVSRLLPYGPLETLEVYFAHDGPKFFTLTAPSLALRVIAICVDDGDDEPGVITYLYLPVSTHRFAEIRAGHLALRDAFVAIGQVIWRVREDHRSDDPTAAAERVLLADLDERDLPDRDARLQLSSPTAPLLDRSELRDLAAGSQRLIGVVELEAQAELATEFPLGGLGRVSLAIQHTLDGLAHEGAKRPQSRGSVAATLASDVQVSVVGVRAASFALVIGSSPRQGLLVNPRLHAALGDLFALISATGEDTAIVPALRRHEGRVRSRFVTLLSALHDSESGIGLITVEPDADTREVHVSRSQVSEALEAVNEVTETRVDIEVSRAMLTASNTSRHTFELIDAATLVTHRGKVDPSAQAQIEGLMVGHNSFVTASLVADVQFASEDEESGRSVTLLSIRARD